MRQHFPDVYAFSDDAPAVVSEPLGGIENVNRFWIERRGNRHRKR
jgi:hypothetical protein